MKQCNCNKQIDKLLATRGDCLVLPIVLTDGPVRAVIRTERLAAASKRVSPTFLCANYCPFCGKKYPTAKKKRGAR